MICMTSKQPLSSHPRLTYCPFLIAPNSRHVALSTTLPLRTTKKSTSVPMRSWPGTSDQMARIWRSSSFQGLAVTSTASNSAWRSMRHFKLKTPFRINVHKVSSMTTPGSISTPLLEEEKASSYDPGSCYPARIGETLHRKYRLISKLGWGTGSTVWLAGVASRSASNIVLPFLSSSPILGI